MQTEPYPTLDELLTMMGEAGRHLAAMGACEGAAGNISVCLSWPEEPRARFPILGEIELPQPVPELAGATFLVTGSGRRLREMLDEPTAHIACIVVNEGGLTGKLYTSNHRRFERVTSEFNSHLAVHYDQMVATGTNFHALVHAHPVHLTFLSHVPRYQDQTYLNTHLLRWQPETIINFPEGIGFIPFRLPGSPELMAANVELFRRYSLVIWARHGVMAHSDVSIKRATDRIEYAEAATRYEYLNLTLGEVSQGLSVDEIRSICRAFDIKQGIF